MSDATSEDLVGPGSTGPSHLDRHHLRRRRRRRRGGRGALRQHLRAVRARKAAGAPVQVDISAIKPGEKLTVEWRGKPVWIVRRTPEQLASLKKIDPQLADPNSERNAVPDARLREEPAPLDQARVLRRRGHLLAPGLLAQRQVHARRAALAARRLGRRLPVPLPRLDLRHGRPRLQEQARARQPRSAAAHVPVRHRSADRRGQEGLSSRRRSNTEDRGSTMAEFKEAPAGAPAAQQFMTWVDNRFPPRKLYKEHMSEYYAPKNFNFWYFFGSLALLVLVIQIVTGIFLVMHYKPDAALAFASVEYIMRDVPWGWLVRYMHSTGASAFFVVVYLHMFRGLIYGSYRKPRELVWIFGCAIFLCLMAEAFMGYLLPWGQMSLLGRAGHRQPVRRHPLHRPRPVAADPRRLRGRRRHAEPLLQLPRHRGAAGAAGPGGGAHHRAARGGLEQPRRRRDQGQEGPEDRHPARRHPVPPVLHGARHPGRERVPDGLHARSSSSRPRWAATSWSTTTSSRPTR